MHHLETDACTCVRKTKCTLGAEKCTFTACEAQQSIGLLSRQHDASFATPLPAHWKPLLNQLLASSHPHLSPSPQAPFRVHAGLHARSREHHAFHVHCQSLWMCAQHPSFLPSVEFSASAPLAAASQVDVSGNSRIRCRAKLDFCVPQCEHCVSTCEVCL